jgi:hypothetical protein
MAGTAATAANMIGVANPSGAASISRTGEPEVGWMEIHFLWRPVQFAWAHDGHLERPLLAALLEEHADFLQGKTRHSQLSHLADAIARRKNFSPASKLLWLSGPWLASPSELQVSPLKLRPAELVQGHFFEPAIVVHNGTDIPYVHNGTDIPYLGTCLARVN